MFLICYLVSGILKHVLQILDLENFEHIPTLPADVKEEDEFLKIGQPFNMYGWPLRSASSIRIRLRDCDKLSTTQPLGLRQSSEECLPTAIRIAPSCFSLFCR